MVGVVASQAHLAVGVIVSLAGFLAMFAAAALFVRRRT
jgi:hypothetical protein